ncbi:MAG: 3-deoxy-manno-octulosonate cytidylyltransferase [Alphaproteobacteria bacterium]|uniref:3-deoxy-manno-octulosonate cytidylyltransferase n=1 Tax=Brevundimonas sp. TaxID=1871086 RepID=UPI001DE35655|nr:3-deoxy-manno-octulosonate cytidylyltransferase [Alphaproteobacteria bacterium]MBU1521088.1 3-deoxy-manno-octulosonate cytidylyltransferase [Alphaproteobacteria bacterium]MBU2030478.1 3-deoxy-manno-octulosonate cytidylyltransferase [Alphaproteobacteria bacterium]MBU2165646.1 3-deoxy-manno-octulosonate cytidylyltransferase [Alphaproteobacteria bacterium]MBU2347940.1 3-deoxy-manno-octulosonate cytidylyltransferase [Alphaproteobacteria bacterium]
MNPLILIPARMAATRLPNKPLADIGGKPMIVRAYQQAEASGLPVAVAAGDPEIVAIIEAIGGRAILTDPDLPSGSDRIRAAVDAIDPEGDFDAVINVQGDMPFADPGLATACAAILHGEPSCDIATLVAIEADLSDRTNPDVVKAILALGKNERQGRALYFTRSTLYGDAPIWRHIGVYGYRRAALNRFCAAPPSPLEKREKLEQLRALEMGMQIWAAVIDEAPLSVDNPADLKAARALA